MPDEAPDNLAELVAQKLSDAEIAAQLGVSGRTVLRWRKRRGLASQWDMSRRPAAAHGTTSCYSAGCRCPACTTAYREYSRDLRARRLILGREDPSLIPHGYSGYGNWGCRCPICKAAGSVHNANTKANRKKRGLPG